MASVAEEVVDYYTYYPVLTISKESGELVYLSAKQVSAQCWGKWFMSDL